MHIIYGRIDQRLPKVANKNLHEQSTIDSSFHKQLNAYGKTNFHNKENEFSVNADMREAYKNINKTTRNGIFIAFIIVMRMKSTVSFIRGAEG